MMLKQIFTFLVCIAALGQNLVFAERDDGFGGSAVDQYISKLSANELKSLVSLDEIGALVPSNDMLGAELKGLVSNIGMAGELQNKIDQLKDIRGIVPDTFGMDMDIGALRDLVKTGEQFSSLQMLVGGELNPKELLSAINMSKVLGPNWGGFDNILNIDVKNVLGDLPQLTGHLSSLVNVVEGIEIPGIDMSVFGNLDFNFDDQMDILRNLGISRGMEDIFASLAPEELTTLINLKDLGVLMDMKDLLSNDLKDILDNPLRLGEFLQGLEALKINLGFLSDNFGADILENMPQLQQLQDLLGPLQDFEALRGIFEDGFSPESVLGMINVVDHLQEGIALPNLFSTNVINEMIFSGDTPNVLSGLNDAVTGSPIPSVDPSTPSSGTMDPSAIFEGGQCTLGEMMEIVACTEAGAKPYCDRNYDGSGAMGRYQFMPGTLRGLDSSCYTGPRSPGVANGFECGGDDCNPAKRPKPQCQKNQDEAMACFTANNKRDLEGTIAENEGKQVCQTSVRCVQPGGGLGSCDRCQSRWANQDPPNKTRGPECTTATEAGILKVAHLGGSGGARAAMRGENRCDIGCGCTFWYLNDGGQRSQGCNGEDDDVESDVCEGATVDPGDPGDPVEPGEPGDPDVPDDPDDEPLVPGTPGFGSGGDDKGLAAQFARGGFRNFEATTVDVAAKGGNVESGTKESDDKSVKDIEDSASRYKTEDDFDFEESMAWIDDFEQFMMPPTMKKLCLYWRISGFRIKFALLPACSVKVNYSEPSAMVEVVGEPGLSYLGDLSDLVAKTEHSDGGVGVGLHGVAFNEAHVFGIPPVSRVKTSGSDQTIRRSFTCDYALMKRPRKWVNMVHPDAPIANVDMGAGVPDELFSRTLPLIVADLDVKARLAWYLGAPDKGKDTPLQLLFASEQRRPDWVEKTASHGDITAADVPCQQDGRIDKDLGFAAVANKTDRKCVGSWGMLEPMTGFSYNNNDLIDKALVGARAYAIAKQESIYPMVAPAPRSGAPAAPKIEYAHIGWKYWYTDFNVEWPYEGKQRFMVGEDGFKWDSVLQKGHYKSKGLSQWLSMDKTTGFGSEAMTKDGLVMTMWKKTTCRLWACCHRWPWDRRWRAVSKWKFLGVTELDDWNTDHSRDFNPPRL